MYTKQAPDRSVFSHRMFLARFRTPKSQHTFADVHKIGSRSGTRADFVTYVWMDGGREGRTNTIYLTALHNSPFGAKIGSVVAKLESLEDHSGKLRRPIWLQRSTVPETFKEICSVHVHKDGC